MSRRFTVVTVALTAVVSLLVGIIVAGGVRRSAMLDASPKSVGRERVARRAAAEQPRLNGLVEFCRRRRADQPGGGQHRCDHAARGVVAPAARPFRDAGSGATDSARTLRERRPRATRRGAAAAAVSSSTPTAASSPTTTSSSAPNGSSSSCPMAAVSGRASSAPTPTPTSR